MQPYEFPEHWSLTEELHEDIALEQDQELAIYEKLHLSQTDFAWRYGAGNWHNVPLPWRDRWQTYRSFMITDRSHISISPTIRQPIVPPETEPIFFDMTVLDDDVLNTPDESTHQEENAQDSDSPLPTGCEQDNYNAQSGDNTVYWPPACTVWHCGQCRVQLSVPALRPGRQTCYICGQSFVGGPLLPQYYKTGRYRDPTPDLTTVPQPQNFNSSLDCKCSIGQQCSCLLYTSDAADD